MAVQNKLVDQHQITPYCLKCREVSADNQRYAPQRVLVFTHRKTIFATDFFQNFSDILAIEKGMTTQKEVLKQERRTSRDCNTLQTNELHRSTEVNEKIE